MSRRANNQLICGRFLIEAVISDTSEAMVYRVVDASGHRYAAKLTVANITDHGSFKEEFEVFKSLTNGQVSYGHRSNGQTPEGFPNVYFFGRHDNKYDVIVMDMLSPDLFQLCQRKTLSTKAYQYLACEMLDRLKELHRHGFVHRDVKPQNFMMDNRGKVHLIDFGLSKRFRDPRTHAHFPEQQEGFFSGTIIYSSINAHRMTTQSRRDDLESLGYSLIEMIKKVLPWEDENQKSRGMSEAATQHVVAKKESSDLESLCRGLPKGIYEYMITVRLMSYSETPDYDGLREMLRRR